MNKEDYKVYSDKMRKSIDAVNADFASVRAGRANASVLDRISVDYYGSPTPIQQIAAIASPDPRQLVITPWDGTALKPIERAIQESDLGINPQNDGKSIRLNFPQLTEEAWNAASAFLYHTWAACISISWPSPSASICPRSHMASALPFCAPSWNSENACSKSWG